jgi:Cupin-like domain
MNASPLMQLDAAPFAADFDKRPFKIRHELENHPLFTLPRLVELARSLDSPVLYFRGDHSINQVEEAPGKKRTFVDRGLERPELSVEETIAQIESCNAWMQLRDVARDPEYRALLGQLIEEFRARSEPVAPGLSAPRADIFISSPGATTPFHLDEEHNFLLQIRGTKKMSIADGARSEVLDRASLRSFFLGNGELARYSEHLEKHSEHVDLSPGDGVHIPSCHPHWVQNGPNVSISFGIVWFSDVTARRRHLYRVNEWLIRAGFNPSAPGERPLSDALKSLPVTVKRKLLRSVRR